MNPLDRRGFLRIAATAVACTACLPLAGCNNTETPDAGPLNIGVAELPEGVRVRREWAGRPLELLRKGDEITARSLLCTHQGCEVVWSADDRIYVCPCHEGRFDEEGRPIYGPPRAPLRQIPVNLQNGTVVVGT